MRLAAASIFRRKNAFGLRSMGKSNLFDGGEI
jgi:hypothetical protein